jgi:MoaA/NifB/PqqE/SkfB family radical SAM enzyme
MTTQHNKVFLTKSGIYTREDETGMFCFSPFTGLIYGVLESDIKKVKKWLDFQDNKIKKVYEETIGIGFKINSKDAKFCQDRLLPDKSDWKNISFPRTPLVINWLITGRCTHDCMYCYANDLMRENVKEPLNSKDIDATIKKVLSLNPLVVVLTGGEPFKSPYLKYIIESLSKKVGIIIDTNGFLLNEDIIKIIKENNVVVRVSIDNLRPQINDRYRLLEKEKKNSEGLIKAIEFLNFCLDNNIATIVHTVAIKQNVNDLITMGDKFVMIGLKVWRILRLSYPNSRPDIHKKLGYDENKYRHFYKRIQNKSIKDWNFRMQVIIQQNSERERNSVILVSPEGKFITESPMNGSGKIVIDPNRPNNPSKAELDSKINWWAHYDRYLNFS